MRIKVALDERKPFGLQDFLRARPEMSGFRTYVPGDRSLMSRDIGLIWVRRSSRRRERSEGRSGDRRARGWSGGRRTVAGMSRARVAVLLQIVSRQLTLPWLQPSTGSPAGICTASRLATEKEVRKRSSRVRGARGRRRSRRLSRSARRGRGPQAALPRHPQRRPPMDPNPQLDENATRVQNPIRRPPNPTNRLHS